MNYKEILEVARPKIGAYCKACPVCNGKACGNSIPGPGAKPPGNVAARNFDAWERYKVNMDTLCENKPIDTTFTLFGREFRSPVFAAPIGGMSLHYGEALTDFDYNDIAVRGSCDYGTAAFIGDSVIPNGFSSSVSVLNSVNGLGIPTIKPWDKESLFERIDLIKGVNSFGFAMDIDGAGLPFLKKLGGKAGSKTVEELREVIEYANIPFILKGIMTPHSARKAVEAGVAGIVVSNHGGRVLAQCPATAEVLESIVEAVDGKVPVFVDGGIRSGVDIFKALALGADAVLLGRPFVSMAYGGGVEAVKFYYEMLENDLRDTMSMCGAHSLKDITRDMVNYY